MSLLLRVVKCCREFVREIEMKKLTLLLAVVLLCVFTSCSEKSTDTTEPSFEPVVEETSAMDTIQLVESKWIQHGYRWSCTDYVQFAEDGTYLATIGNGGYYSGTYSLDGSKLYMNNEDGELIDIMDFDEARDTFVSSMRTMTVSSPEDEYTPIGVTYELTRCTNMEDWNCNSHLEDYKGAVSPDFCWAKDIPDIDNIIACYQSCDNGIFLVTTGDDYIYDENTGLQYYPVENFNSITEIRENLCHYLTPELADETLAHNDFEMIDGRLYVIMGGKGLISYDYYGNQLVKQDSNGFYYINCMLYNSGNMPCESYNFYLQDTSSGLRLCKVEEA